MIASRGVVRTNSKPQVPGRNPNPTEKKSFVIKTRTNGVAPSPQAPNKYTPAYKEYPSVPVNSFGMKNEQPPVVKTPAPNPIDHSNELSGNLRQTNGFSKPTATIGRTTDADKKEMQFLLARKKELEERKSELDRLIDEEDQKNVALSNVCYFQQGN